MNTYANRYAEKRTSVRGRIAGHKGTVIRLIVMGLFTLITLLISFGTLPGYAVKLGLWRAVLEAFSGCGLLLMAISFFWGLIKWIAMVAPKSFGLANRMWRGWIPLTFFGLYIKSVIWLLVGLVPCMIFGMLYSPIVILGFKLAQGGMNILTALATFLAGAALVGILALLDGCKLFAVSPATLIKQKLFGRK